MEKKTKTRKTKKETIVEVPETVISKEEQSNIEEMRVYGFRDSMEVARSLMGSIHENLLRGDLIFAYTSSSSANKTTLHQVVVVNDLVQKPSGLCKTNFYSISIITSGYSAYIPHMPIEYLDEVSKDLEEGKADKKIIEAFKKIITGLKGGTV